MRPTQFLFLLLVSLFAFVSSAKAATLGGLLSDGFKIVAASTTPMDEVTKITLQIIYLQRGTEAYFCTEDLEPMQAGHAANCWKLS